jgi:putative endopeptidase
MKKTIISAAIASVFILGACSKQGEQEQTNTAEKTASAFMAKEAAELGSFGVELDARDESIKPGDDFFKYAGGTWYKNFEIPSDKTRYGAFDKLAERSETQIKELVEEISQGKNLSSEQQMIADFYASFMDTDTANAKGISPITPIL